MVKFAVSVNIPHGTEIEAAERFGNHGVDDVSLDENVSLHSGQETILHDGDPIPVVGGGFRFHTQLPMEEPARHVISRNRRGPNREIPAACQTTRIMDQDWAGGNTCCWINGPLFGPNI